MKTVVWLVLFFFPVRLTPTNITVVDVDMRVCLKGVLKYEIFFGPPGFGEDTSVDSREPTYILYLKQGILFRDSSLCQTADVATCPYDTVRTIHVRIPMHDSLASLRANQLRDKQVTIECTLFGGITGHHHAPAVTERIFSMKAK